MILKPPDTHPNPPVAEVGAVKKGGLPSHPSSRPLHGLGCNEGSPIDFGQFDILQPGPLTGLGFN